MIADLAIFDHHLQNKLNRSILQVLTDPHVLQNKLKRSILRVLMELLEIQRKGLLLTIQRCYHFRIRRKARIGSSLKARERKMLMYQNQSSISLTTS